MATIKAKPKAAAEWRDATGYSHGERGKVEPRTWEYMAGAVRVVVTRKYGDGRWYLWAAQLDIERPLSAVELESAKDEAFAVCRGRIEDRMRELREAFAAMSVPSPG